MSIHNLPQCLEGWGMPVRRNPILALSSPYFPSILSGSLAGLVYWRKDRKGDPWRDGTCQSSNVATSNVGENIFRFIQCLFSY